MLRSRACRPAASPPSKSIQGDRKMKRFVPFAAVVAGAMTWTGSGLAQSRKHSSHSNRASTVPTATNPHAPDEVIRWNRELLALLQAPGAQPSAVHPPRTMAIVQLAVFDAVDAIHGSHQPYLPTAPAPRHASAS